MHRTGPAASCFDEERALLITESQCGARSSKTAQARFELANTLGVQGQIDRALRCAIEANQAFSTLSCSDFVIANSFIQLGALSAKGGSIPKALEHFDKALPLLFRSTSSDSFARHFELIQDDPVPQPASFRRVQLVIQAIFRLKMHALPLSQRTLLRGIIAETPGSSSFEGDKEIIKYVVSELLQRGPEGETAEYIDELLDDIYRSMQKSIMQKGEEGHGNAAGSAPLGSQQLACLAHMFWREETRHDSNALLGVWELPDIGWPFRRN